MLHAYPMKNSRFQELRAVSTDNEDRRIVRIQEVEVRQVQNDEEKFVLVQVNDTKEDVLGGVWEGEGELPSAVFLIPEAAVEEFALGRKVDGISFMFGETLEEGDRLCSPTNFFPIVVGLCHHTCSIEIVGDDFIDVFVFPNEGFKRCFVRSLQEREPWRRPNHSSFRSPPNSSSLKLA